ncbi:MAG: RecX family transcriptional regulator [Clostridiales bacterium]|nr:RecX family transcriptional regulator [Clostridiales bacterium]
MQITDIQHQKKIDNRYNIYIDNVYTFSADIEDIVRFDLKVGNEYTEEEINFFINECEIRKGFKYALYLLNNRDYCKKEIVEKLFMKGYSDNSINNIIEKLKEYNLINDKIFAQKYINNKLKYKKNGKYKVINELKLKGISNEILEEIDIDDGIQIENAYSIALKKIKSLKEKDNKIAKIKRFLYYKGYDSDIIDKVIRKLFDNFSQE